MTSAGAAQAVPVQAGGPARWLVVVLLFLAILINYVDRGNLSIVAVPLMGDFGIGPPAMGTLLSAFFWTYALLQIPAGYVVDRFGLKWTYAIAFVLWSLSSAAIGLASSFQQILAFRLLLGAGEAVAAPASLSYIRQNFREEEQGLPTAVYVAGMMVGPAVGAFLGAALLEQLGWRQLFILTGLGGCVWLLPWLIWAPKRRKKVIDGERPIPAKAAPMPWRLLFTTPFFWGITIGAFFYSYYWYFLLTWMPSYLVMAHGLSFMQMGTYTAVPLLGMAITAAIGGRLADRVIKQGHAAVVVRRRFACGGFLLGSSILLLLAVESSTAVFAILIVSLLGLGLASANYWALTQALTPAPVIGRVIGYQNTVANLAGVCAPVLTGFLIGDTKDFRSSILFAGSSLIVAAAAYLFLIRERDADALKRSIGEA